MHMRLQLRQVHLWQGRMPATSHRQKAARLSGWMAPKVEYNRQGAAGSSRNFMKDMDLA